MSEQIGNLSRKWKLSKETSETLNLKRTTEMNNALNGLNNSLKRRKDILYL